MFLVVVMLLLCRGWQGQRAEHAAGRRDVRLHVPPEGGPGLQAVGAPPPRPAHHEHQGTRSSLSPAKLECLLGAEPFSRNAFTDARSFAYLYLGYWRSSDPPLSTK